MNQRRITCTCGISKTVDDNGRNGYNVADMRSQLGEWEFIPLHDGNCVWLCKDCNDKAEALAKSLVDTVGSRDFIIRSFLRPKK